MSTAISKTTEASKAAIYAEDVEWESDGTEAVGIEFPTISIVQGTSKFPNSGRHGGEFWHSDREEYEGTLEVVPLYMANQRALFEDGKDAPSCSSLDGVAPAPGATVWKQETVKLRNMAQPVAHGRYAAPNTCADCPFSEWGEDGSPPPCKETILLLVERDDASFARIRFGGLSLKPFRKMLRSKFVSKNRRVPLFTHRLHLSATEWTSGQNKAYVLQADPEPLPLEDQRRYNELVKSIRSSITTAATRVDEAEAEHEPAAPRTEWPEE